MWKKRDKKWIFFKWGEKMRKQVEKKVKKVDFFLKTLQKKKIIKSWKKVEEKKLGTKVKIVLKKTF